MVAGDSIAVKRNICTTLNRSIGLTANGEEPTYGFCESKLEKGMLCGATLLPIWSNKTKVYNFATSGWQNIGSAYAQGARNGYSTLRHPTNYWNLEFLNGKIGKIEGVMAKNMPKMPKLTGTNASQLEALFQQLAGAKNTSEYARIVQANKSLYKTLGNIMRRQDAANWTKLTQMAKYNEIYGKTLKYMQNARTTLTNGGVLRKGKMASMHKMFADARLAENKWLRTVGKAGKQGAGLWAKGGAWLSKSIKTKMATSKTLRSVTRGAGKLGGWLALGLSAVGAVTDGIAAYQVGKDKGEGWSNVGKQALKSTGRIACGLGAATIGQWAGAAIGQVLIPIPGVGAAIGGTIGSFAGFWLGSKLADNVPGINKSVAEEEMEKQAQAQKQALCKAVDEGDWQFVIQYVEANKSPKVQVNEKGEKILDAEGNPQPVLDANGNQVFEYAQISDKPEEQKAFEAEIDKLHAWVEEKYVEAVKAEQVKQQAEVGSQVEFSQYGGSGTGNSGYGTYGTGLNRYGTGNSGYGTYGTGLNRYGTGNSGYGTYGTGLNRYGTGNSGYGTYGMGLNSYGFDLTSKDGQYNIYSNPSTYSNLAYNFDNGKLDFLNASNQFMMNYNNNIFTTRYGQQAS